MKKLCLIIIDGFGVADPGPGNARTLANTPTIDSLETTVPNTKMEASGNAVGLPEGEMGNSESGHLTIGSGRVVWQPLAKINKAIETGDFFTNPVLTSACQRAAANNVTLHLMGLYSEGGIHSHIKHFQAMLQLAQDKGVQNIRLHLFADGRDVPEKHFCIDYDLLQTELSEKSFAKVSSIIGRLYMDRDKNWETRTKVAYDLFTTGKGKEVDDVSEAVKQWYVKAPDKQDTDYYIEPLKTAEYEPMKSEDVVVCLNFRNDRMIQIVQALADEQFHEFTRPVRITDVNCMGPYSDHLPIAFPPEKLEHSLGGVVSNAGIKQLRMAETDKMPHVTFFFNAQRTEPYEHEDRILVESPKVPNYADTPKMSANKLNDELIKNVQSEKYGFIVVNFANPDLVGHGGKLDAAIIACETVDQQLARLLPELEKHGYDWVITADHGNSECMLYEDGVTACPTHTTNPVQTFVKSDKISQEYLDACTTLKSIAPMCLDILGLEVPDEMA